MAESTDEKVKRGVGRTLANATLFLIVVGVVGVWGSMGLYQLEQGGGEAALILRFAKFQRTETTPGLHWHLPPPIETHVIEKLGELESEEFGASEGQASGTTAAESAQAPRGDLVVQTKENNIVNLSFAVQYKRKNAYDARYQVADLQATLRAAAQAAVREVVGRTSIDDVLSEGRGQVQADARALLQDILDRYDAGIAVDRVLLQEVAPPPEVRDAFDDVIAANQDEQRQVQQAEGYRNEVLPQARAKANEIERSAEAYRDAKVAEAGGEADRFESILAEYRRAPEVTRKRMYLEAMEEVLPKVRKLIIEPGTGAMLPFFPQQNGVATPPAAAGARP